MLCTVFLLGALCETENMYLLFCFSVAVSLRRLRQRGVMVKARSRECPVAGSNPAGVPFRVSGVFVYLP